MSRRLENRNAIVTGAARGMGKAIAKALFNEGARVMIVDTDEKSARESAQAMDSEAKRAFARRVDVTDRKAVRAAVQRLVETWGSVDILVNNAGGALNTPSRLEEIEERHWNLVLDVNLKGTFFFCQAAIPQMARQGKGSIINISALAAHWRASLAGVQYTAAKAGVEGLTRQLAYDWGKEGIRVNAVAPTVTITGERVGGLWDNKSEQEKQRVLAAIPLGRLSTPEEIAAAVVFLASDEAGYITGICLDVCGGRYLR